MIVNTDDTVALRCKVCGLHAWLQIWQDLENFLMSVDRNTSQITDFTDHAFLCDNDILPTEFPTSVRTPDTTPIDDTETDAAGGQYAEESTRQLHLQSVDESSLPPERSTTSSWATEKDASTGIDVQMSCGSSCNWQPQDQKVDANVTDVTMPCTEDGTLCDRSESYAHVNQDVTAPVNTVKQFKSILVLLLFINFFLLLQFESPFFL